MISGNGSKDLCLEGPRVSAVLAPITGGGCAVVDGALGQPLARPARAVRQLSFGETPLLSLDRDGVLDAVLAALAREADLEWLMIDSTIVPAHQHAAGARKAKGGDAQGRGRSRGGLSTKIHAAGDGLGNPIRLIGTPGQRNDIAFAHDLIDGLTADVTIADKGYDVDHLVDKLTQTGAEAVIPSKRNRRVQRRYDIHLYKERNIIERFINKLS
jgi:putative transposase